MTPRSRCFQAAAVTVVLLAPAISRAEQFTMFDFTYEATKANTHDAHYDVKPPQYTLTQPDNWKAPIDYTKGTVYIEQDVLTKPSEEETQVDICFLTAKGYGCRNTEHYFKVGRNTTIRAVTRFNDFDQIDWTKKIPLVQLIVKDKNNRNGGVPVENFMPTKMRIAMTFVSEGGTYTPPPGFAPVPTADGGAPGADGSARADAAAVDPGPGPVPKDGGTVTEPDAGVRPDAVAASDPPPQTGGPRDAGAPKRLDASAPPEDPEPEQPRGNASNGCAVGGRGPGAGVLAVLGLLVAVLSRRRR